VTDAPGHPPEDRDDAEDSASAEPHREHGSEDEIDEAGDESFPASDAPQWWSGEPDDADK
jgi:hypothetical protein